MVMNKGTAKEKVQMVNARHRRTARIETSSGFPDHNFVEPPPSAAAAALALNPKLAPPAVASVRTIVRFALLSLLFCSLFIAAVLIVDTTVVIPSFAFPPLLPIVVFVVVVVVVVILALVVVFFFFLPAMKFPISKVEGDEECAIVLLRCCCYPPRKKLEP
jgi:magnesium-transporting ATPase (P-type)